MEKNEIELNGKIYNLQKIEDRSAVLQILRDAMNGCNEDYFQAEGDFKIIGGKIK